jgi:NADPH:quinone reductase-like Zn-dependent oxidoreductase
MLFRIVETNLFSNSGVSFNDIMTRNGMLDNWAKTWKMPFIMGSEVAGEVVGLGRNVINLKVN